MNGALDPTARAVLILGALPWYDLGKHLTCSEADEAFTALNILGQTGAARALMLDHADADEEPDDMHYTTKDPDGLGYEWHRRELDLNA